MKDCLFVCIKEKKWCTLRAEWHSRGLRQRGRGRVKAEKDARVMETQEGQGRGEIEPKWQKRRLRLTKKVVDERHSEAKS